MSLRYTSGYALKPEILVGVAALKFWSVPAGAEDQRTSCDGVCKEAGVPDLHGTDRAPFHGCRDHETHARRQPRVPRGVGTELAVCGMVFFAGRGLYLARLSAVVVSVWKS